MRGLTPDEYALLSEMASFRSDRVLTSAEVRTFRRLEKVGRTKLLHHAHDPTYKYASITAAGREAMRLHAALSALGAV